MHNTPIIIISILICMMIFIKGQKNPIEKWWLSSFMFTWMAILTISTLNPYDLYEVDTYVYILYILFIYSYSTGFSLAKKTNTIQSASRSINFFEIHNMIESKLLLIVLLTLNIVLTYYVIKYLDYVFAAGISEAREARFFIGKVFQSGHEMAAFNYIVTPALWFSMFMFSYGIAFGNIRKIYWILSLSSILLYASFGAGRNIVLEILIITGLMYALKSNSKEKLKKTNKLSILLFGIVFLAIGIGATAFRLEASGNYDLESLINASFILIDNFFIYFLGSIRAFQHAYENPEKYLNLSFGLLTFSGVDELISYFLKLVGFNINPYTWKFGPILNEQIQISQSQNFNALYGAIYNFYFDFDIAGIIIFGCFFGYISASTLNKFLKYQKPEYLFASSILFTASIWSTLSWKLQNGEFIIMIITPLIIGYFRKPKKIPK